MATLESARNAHKSFNITGLWENGETKRHLKKRLQCMHYVPGYLVRWILCAIDRRLFTVRLQQQKNRNLFFCLCARNIQLHVREPAKFKHINRQWNSNEPRLSQ